MHTQNTTIKASASQNRATYNLPIPTAQDHIRDLHDAATRFEDRAKRAEAHAERLAEALRNLSETVECEPKGSPNISAVLQTRFTTSRNTNLD